MARLLDGSDWTISRWAAAPKPLAPPLDPEPAPMPFIEELRIVAALALLAALVVLLI